MKRLSAHTQPTNLYMCFSLSCPADVEGKCFSFGTNAVSLEGKLLGHDALDGYLHANKRNSYSPMST